ncbi:MAG: AAA family ATPase [Gemmatimonadota bacterium]|nr:AAA family ATPase [Gemmatimonadota bacterium]
MSVTVINPDGPFLQMINTAKDDPESQYTIIIEEINRGNPAQIFGEMLTLLESDKRNEVEALELSYRKSEGERVYIPENLYVIGTMNVADRSIAMVDFALRRRFAFVDLEPIFGSVWRNWVHDQCKIDEAFLSQVEERMYALNEQIAEDSNLGAQFRVGHSYVTPSAGEIDDSREWFKQVVETEIGPLLDEYWFDALDTAQKAREQLLEGL